MNRVDAILTQLPQFSPEELDRLRAGVVAFHGLGPRAPQSSAEPRTDDSEAQAVLGILVDELARKGLEFAPASALAKTQDYDPFRAKLAAVLKYFEASRLSKVERLAVMRVGVGLLYLDLVRLDVPVSSRLLMRHFHRLPSVLDRGFPGYARCGLLGKIAVLASG